LRPHPPGPSRVMSAEGTAETEEEEAGLLASFPNLKGLPPFEVPEADWGTAELPKVPPQAITGVLGNGLTYYVHENREPKARAELFLVVGFGSLVEEDPEQGIAHIIEHLGFSATKAYENHAIVKFLESIGAPFGACQNAYTSFDRTVYTLHIPTDKEGLVTESLTVLREFAYFTRISDEDLDKERKVVLEEWRESRNAQGRLFEQYICALCKGCKWCERLPIGKEEVIRGVSSEVLRSFYSRYYHPARMAVVAVGDFEGPAVVKTIQELFDIPPGEISPLPRAPQAPERPRHAVPDSEGVTVASSTDRELSFAQGIVDCKRPRLGPKSVSGLRRRLTEELFHKALSSRLLKLMLEPKGPRNFFAVGTETGEPVPPLNTMSITIAPLPGRMRPALKAILLEIERVKRLGFHEAEVRRAMRSILAEYEEEYIEREQRPSESFAEEYVSLFLDDAPAPGVMQRAQVAATVLPSITCAEISAVAEQFNFERNVVVKIATPPLSLRNPLYTFWSLFQACRNLVAPRPKLDLPDSSEVAEIMRVAAAEPLEPWPQDDDDVDSRLRRNFEACVAKRAGATSQALQAAGPGVGEPPREVFAEGVPRPARGGPAKLVEAEGAALSGPLGVEVILKNGLRVFLQHTDLFEDEIVLRARRWGGLSEHQTKGFFEKGVITTEAQVCSMVAMMLGICGMSMESMQECLDGKRLEPNPPGLEAYHTGFDASASPMDFDSLLLLLHLLFSRPVEPGTKSRSRLSLVKLSLLAWRLSENRDPQAQFQRRLQRCITQDHPFARLPSLWSILRLDFKRASAIFNECASRPCEWTFALVGRLPPRETLLPLLEKYLGSIPNPDDGQGPPVRRSEVAVREALTPLNIEFPPKPVKEDVKLNMIDPKGTTVLVFPIQLRSITMPGSRESAEAELRELFRLRLLIRLLEIRLIEVLRFKRGQVYSVSVADDMALSPPQLGRARRGTFSIGFECDPDEADELVQVTRAELDQLRDGSAAFTAANVEAVLQQDQREFEELTQKNDWWATTVMDLYFSRCHAVSGEIGKTIALWWRTRAEVVSAFDAEAATEALKAALPVGASSAVVAMRPRSSAKRAKKSHDDTTSSSSVKAD